ncbi:MAG: serine hydrolase domain-containing protein [Bacillota bacterium]|nr:serine hydrolase domain-containing protein [Bacillota bacterium]
MRLRTQKFKFLSFSGIASLILLSILTSCESKSKDEKTPEMTHVAAEEQIIENNEARKIKNYMEGNELNGSVFVSVANTPIFKGGFGYADFEKRTKNTVKTTFPIASLTKMVVAASFLQMKEKGLLNLNDPIGKYIIGFPNGQNIKLIHLLTNTSGITSPSWSGISVIPKDIVNEIKKSPIIFQAGANWNYQDANYILLSYILEKVSGISLHEYIKKNIFSIAEMKSSGFITRKNTFPYAAKGYFKVQNHFEPIGKLNIHLLYGAGDMYSTVEDINKFDTALMECRFFSKKSLDEMMVPRSKSHYGLGIYIYNDYLFSRGTLGGWNAVHVYFKDKTNVVLLLNARSRKMDILKNAKEIHQLIKK